MELEELVSGLRLDYLIYRNKFSSHIEILMGNICGTNIRKLTPALFDRSLKDYLSHSQC